MSKKTYLYLKYVLFVKIDSSFKIFSSSVTFKVIKLLVFRELIFKTNVLTLLFILTIDQFAILTLLIVLKKNSHCV